MVVLRMGGAHSIYPLLLGVWKGVLTMPDTLKPLPCPCGAMPRHVMFTRPFAGFVIHQVMCYSCNTKPKIFGRGITKQKAIDAWNRRVGHEPAGECAEHNRAERGAWCGEEGEKG